VGFAPNCPLLMPGRGDEARLGADVQPIHVLILLPQERRGWPGHRRETPRPAMTERGCPATQERPTCACSRHCRRGIADDWSVVSRIGWRADGAFGCSRRRTARGGYPRGVAAAVAAHRA